MACFFTFGIFLNPVSSKLDNDGQFAKKTVINSVQSSMKYHPVWVTLYPFTG